MLTNGPAVMAPREAQPSDLLVRVREWRPDVPWVDAERIDANTQGRWGAWDRPVQTRAQVVHGPEMTSAEANALVSGARTAGLVAEVVIVQQGRLDDETLTWGPSTWRVQISQ